MISIFNDKPEHQQHVLIKTNKGYFGVAIYDKVFGFEADDSAYDIHCDDDSGLNVFIDGTVTHWLPLTIDVIGLFE